MAMLLAKILAASISGKASVEESTHRLVHTTAQIMPLKPSNKASRHKMYFCLAYCHVATILVIQIISSVVLIA